jgi:hypothetical protein
MLRAVQPDSGGRFQAVLISEQASGARFRVELSTSAGVWQNEASVSESAGEVEWGTWSVTAHLPAAEPAEPPEWLCRYLRAALRSAWRGRAEDGWPRRLTRWRDAPDARRDESGG